VDQIKKIHLKISQMKSEIKPEILKGTQKSYLKKFIRSNRQPIIWFLVLALVECLLMISLPIILKYLVENDYNYFRLHNLYFDVVLLTVLVVAYVFTSYGLIRLGQTIGFNLINQIKMHWLNYFYQTASSQVSELSDGTLITKFVYHTQLLKMSLEKVLMEGSQALIFYLVILASAFLFSSTTFFWLLLGFPLLCVIFWIFYLIGRHYVRKEQTLNTRLVKSLVQQSANLQQTQSLGLVSQRYKMIGQLLEQDTFFRKRREIWVKFSDRLVFSLILLCGGLVYVLKDFYPILTWNNWSDSAIGLILAGFFTKIVIQISHAGLFAQALKTGLIISVPEFSVGDQPPVAGPEINFKESIEVYGEKVKISKFAGVIRKFALEILPKTKTLIRSEGPLGKSTLARYLCGLTEVRSLNVKNGKSRILASNWGNTNKSRHYISLSQIHRESVAEFLLAKPGDEIIQSDLEQMFLKLNQYPEFQFIFKFNDFLSKRFSSFLSSETETILLQIAQAILNNPHLICVDHDVFDSPNQTVRRGLKILEEACPDSTLVYFSGLVNPEVSASFSNIYTLTRDEIKKA
jgi:hypothetical protein